jgi:hypothetical protein
MICSRKDCANEAAFQIGFRVWLRHQRRSTKPTEAWLGLNVCKDHKKGLKIKHVLSQEGIDHLNRCLAAEGRGPINTKTAYIVFNDLTRRNIKFPKELFVG